MKTTISSHLMKNPPPIAAEKRRLRVFDDRVTGFFVEFRRTATGIRASFSLRYFDVRHRERTLTLGRHGDVTVAQARRRAEELRAMVALGGDPAADRDRLRAIPTVSDFLDERLLPHVREHLRGAVTYEAFARRVKAALGRRHLDEVAPRDIDVFRKGLLAEGLSAATVNRHLAFARMAFNKARDWGYLQGANPAASPGMLPEQARDRYLTPAQGKALIAALAEEPDRPAAVAIGLLMLTGARKSEILNATWEAIDFGRGLLLVPRAKSGRPHRIPLSPAAKRLLLLHRGPRAASGYVFPGRSPGNPRSTVRGAWERAKTAAALPTDLRLHDLRHSFASALVNRGIPLHEVGVLLGHSQLSTTARYAHHAPDRLIRTASIAAEVWEVSAPQPPLLEHDHD
ncbi:tyrosine-type recombinase/integrase [Novispirillum sp. DQ9]|uniref:tyrosine-type recombinase/integrase n=1 Tax=Novispirillum sp. DQ9 TaxID=3398612 RepID=UPI003C7B8295